jgi:hypothetical protein
MLESDYVNVEPPKPPPPVPVRVSRKSHLIAALRQNVRPIVIEDQELARPFAAWYGPGSHACGRSAPLSQTRCPTRLGGPVAPTSRRIGTSADMSNVQKVILKPKPLRYTSETPALVRAFSEVSSERTSRRLN